MNKYFYSLLTLFFVTFSYAETTSSISGDVNISDVTVTVTHIPTGSVKKVTTDGDFRFSSLRPGGPYKITASKSGFETETLDNVYLVLNDNVNFSINTVDATGVEDLLVNQKGHIIRMIRDAANEHGESFLESVSDSEYGGQM